MKNSSKNDNTHNNLEQAYILRSDRHYLAAFRVIGKATEGWSAPDLVQITYQGRTVIGYFKSTQKMGDRNDIEIVLTQIGRSIGVAMAESIVVYSDSAYKNQVGIVSICVDRQPQKRFVSFREMRDELYRDLINKEIVETPWITRWKNIRSRKVFLPTETWEFAAQGTQEYLDTLQFAMEISHLYANKHHIRCVNLEEPYERMLLFDILIGQADRSPSNYGCIIDFEEKTASYSPLFDNSTLTKPYIPGNYISLNHMLLDRTMTARACGQLFGTYVLDFCKRILENEHTILSIVDTSTYFSNNSVREFLHRKIEGGILALGEIV